MYNVWKKGLVGLLLLGGAHPLASSMAYGTAGGLPPVASGIVEGRPHQASPRLKLQVSFVRDGHLWIKRDGEEEQVTSGRELAESPVWSGDGRFVAYVQRTTGTDKTELWVYSLDSRKKTAVSRKGAAQAQWAPGRPVLAYVADGTLNAVEVHVDGFHVVSPGRLTGISSFSWLPDGSRLLLSAEARLVNDTWTPVQLFTAPADAGGWDDPRVRPFFSLPGQSDAFFAVGTTPFKWSADRRWIAFIAKPTASLSTDGNTLCLLSSDGRRFHMEGKMLAYPSWFQWAPSARKLGYISGEGRMAVQDKMLRIVELPAMSLHKEPSPKWTDRDFCWLDDGHLVRSQAPSAPWDSDPSKRPLPSLYRSTVMEVGQGRDGQQLTEPPPGSGDFVPVDLPQADRLAWVRSDRAHGEVWLGRRDGSGAEVYVKTIDAPQDYYDHPPWEQVLAWYNAPVRPEPAAAGMDLHAEPSYAKWGRLAMEETSRRYAKKALIRDYLYVGHKEVSQAVMQDTFKLWLEGEGKGFAVFVTIRWEKPTERLLSIHFREKDR